jgi:ribosomal protein S16
MLREVTGGAQGALATRIVIARSVATKQSRQIRIVGHFAPWIASLRSQ